LAENSSDTTISPKSFGILANDKPRPEMPERGDRFSADTSGQKWKRRDSEEVAKW